MDLFCLQNYLHTSFKKLIGDSNPPRTPLYNQFSERFYGDIVWRAQRSLLAESSKMLRLFTIHNAYRPLLRREFCIN